MQQHVRVGVVDGVDKQLVATHLVVVQVQQLDRQLVREQRLELLHDLVDQLVQREEHVGVGACGQAGLVSQPPLVFTQMP